MSRRRQFLRVVLAACAPVTCAQVARAVNPSPLENAYWRFEEGADGVAVDPANTNAVTDSANANHMRAFAAVNAPSYTSSVPADIIPQTGSDNSLAMATTTFRDIYTDLKNINHPITTAFTLEASFRVNVLDGTYQCIVGKDGKPTAAPLSPLELKVRGDDSTLQIELIDASGNPRNVRSQSAINAGQWYHAAAVSDGSTLSLYLNSGDGAGYVFQASTPTSGALYQLDSAWSIGRGAFADAPADSFKGTIDEVRLSNTALDPSRLLFAPANSTWTINSNGTWSTAVNWQGNNIPRVAGATANFTSAIDADRTITLDAPQSLGTLNFDNANRYTLAGSALTLNTLSGDAQINVLSGNHIIATPLTLAVNTHVQLGQSSAASLTITGSLTAAGRALTIDAGSPDSVLTVPNIRSSTLTVHNGIVRVAPGGAATFSTSLLETAPTLDATARFDLTNNALVIDYADPSPAATIRQLLIAGRNSANFQTAPWNGPGGITSSSAAAASANFALGYVENSFLPNLGLSSYTVFAEQTVDASSLLIRYTRAADANLDGKVNTDDVTIVGALFNNPLSNEWYLGDFDYDGLCDIDDVTRMGLLYDPNAPALSLAQLTAQYGSDFASAFARGRAMSVPEPTTSLLSTLLAASPFLARRRRRCVE